MDFTAIANQIAVLFLVLLTGYIIKKLHIIDENASRRMSSLIVNVSSPFLIVSSMMKEIDLTPRDILNIFLLSLSVYFFLFLLTLIVPKLLKVRAEDQGIYQFMIFFSNVAFMGFPVIYAMFGDIGIVYTAVFNIPFYLLVYTLGIYFVSKNTGKTVAFELKQMINAGVVAVMIGTFFFLTGLKLPSFMGSFMEMIGDLTTPLSMLVIGASLAGIQMRKLFLNVRLYLYSIIKLILIPLVVFFALTSLGFTGLFVGVPVVITGMPAAANSVILSKIYGGNDVLAAEGVFMTTVFFGASVLFLAALLNNVF